MIHAPGPELKSWLSNENSNEGAHTEHSTSSLANMKTLPAELTFIDGNGLTEICVVL